MYEPIFTMFRPYGRSLTAKSRQRRGGNEVASSRGWVRVKVANYALFKRFIQYFIFRRRRDALAIIQVLTQFKLKKIIHALK